MVSVLGAIDLGGLYLLISECYFLSRLSFLPSTCLLLFISIRNILLMMAWRNDLPLFALLWNSPNLKLIFQILSEHFGTRKKTTNAKSYFPCNSLVWLHGVILAIGLCFEKTHVLCFFFFFISQNTKEPDSTVKMLISMVKCKVHK